MLSDKDVFFSYLMASAEAAFYRLPIRQACFDVIRRIDAIEGLNPDTLIYFIESIDDKTVTVRRNTAFGKPWSTTFPSHYLWEPSWETDYVKTHHQEKLESTDHEMEDHPRG